MDTAIKMKKIPNIERRSLLLFSRGSGCKMIFTLTLALSVLLNNKFQFHLLMFLSFDNTTFPMILLKSHYADYCE